MNAHMPVVDEKEDNCQAEPNGSKICENMIESPVKSQKSPKANEKKKKKERSASDKKDRKASRSLELMPMSIVEAANDIPEFVIPPESNCRPNSAKGGSGDIMMVNEAADGQCIQGSQADPDGQSSSESQPIPSLSKFDVLTYYL